MAVSMMVTGFSFAVLERKCCGSSDESCTGESLPFDRLIAALERAKGSHTTLVSPG